MSAVRVEHLINGYSAPTYLPKDIIIMINMLLLSTNSSPKLYNIISPQKHYSIQFNYYKFPFWIRYNPKTFNLNPKCIVNNAYLPPILHTQNIDECPFNQWISNKWSLIFQTKSEYLSRSCSLTAIHSDSLSNNMCIAYNFSLPSINSPISLGGILPSVIAREANS